MTEISPMRALQFAGAAAVLTGVVAACGGSGDGGAAENAALVAQGQQIFRYDTFGDEAQWTTS